MSPVAVLMRRKQMKIDHFTDKTRVAFATDEHTQWEKVLHFPNPGLVAKVKLLFWIKISPSWLLFKWSGILVKFLESLDSFRFLFELFGDSSCFRLTFGHFWTLFGTFRNLFPWPIFSFFSSFFNILGHFEPFWTIFRQFLAIFSHIWTFWNWNRNDPMKLIENKMKLIRKLFENGTKMIQNGPNLKHPCAHKNNFTFKLKSIFMGFSKD